MNIVFAITGTLALYLAGDVLHFIGVMHGDVSNVVYWTLRILVIIPVYQILLIVIGTVFGEFYIFGKWRKRCFLDLGKSPRWSVLSI